MSSVVVEALLILAHYPSYRSLDLSPQEIYRVKSSLEKGHPFRVDTQLPILLQHFSSTLEVTPDDLRRYYTSFYDDQGEEQKRARIKEALSNPVLQSLMTARVTKLLESNNDLLKLEFLRHCSGESTPDPFTKGLVRPVCPHDGGLSEASALAFAKTLGIPSNVAENELKEVLLLMGEGSVISGSGMFELTFSCFVIYAVRCVVSHAKVNMGSSQHLREKDVEGCISNMLHAFSARLTRLQQRLQMRVLGPLVARDQKARVEAAFAESSIEGILMKAQGYYLHDIEGGRAVNAAATNLELPPRPPAILLDAPRAAAGFVHNGVVEKVGGLVRLWCAFTYIQQQGKSPLSDKWSAVALAVSPTPVSTTPTRMSRGDVKGVYAELLSAVTQTEAHSRVITADTVLPLLVARADHTLDTSSSSTARTERGNIELEDVLRFGGARGVSSLAENQAWLRSLYTKLASVGDYDEVLVNLACRVLSCHGLLRIGTVALQAKLSIHSRHRVSDMQPGIVTLSLTEFEELFLRCAYVLWDDIGHSVPPVTPMQYPDFDSYPHLDSAAGQTSAVALYYKQQCAVTESLRSASGPGVSAWGTDFVWPYASALLRGGVEQVQGGGMNDLCAFLGVEGGLVKSLFEWIEEGVDEGEGKRLDTPINTDVSAVGHGRQDEEVQPAEDTRDAESLLASAEVKSRSDELLEGILKSRTSAPLTPQKKAILQSIFDGQDGSKRALPLVRRSHDHDSGATTHDSEEVLQAPSSPEVPKHGSNRKIISSPTRTLLDGTKEALWPVYGTYCSCGDSLDPGKLSGPNLFALLSKLGVLTDTTVMSDIGILLHQISAHTHSSSVSIAATSSSEAFESPSLSFEEFLVFLCAFAQLRFDGEVTAPILNSGELSQELSSAGSQNTDIWLQNWKAFMGSSSAFRRLMEECVLPILRVHPLLAFPEDARHRDCYCAVFSLEVLLAVESSEALLREAFRGSGTPDSRSGSGGVEVPTIVSALKRVDLIPNVVNEDEVLQLIRDVVPEGQKHTRNALQRMIFPQWEWVICVVAFQAVEKEKGVRNIEIQDKNIPSQIADVITYIATNACQ